MNALGRHILAEFYGCPSEILNDIQRIERIRSTRRWKRCRSSGNFQNLARGVSGVVVISNHTRQFILGPN